MKKNKKSGFTLAETLITLTIIGIIAAMTVPTLMGKYQQRALESQFKKSYAMLNQALSLNQNFDCYYDRETLTKVTSECMDFRSALFNQLKYVKMENPEPLPYKKADTVIAEGGVALDYATSIHSNNHYKYYMADGSTIYQQNASGWGVLYLTLDVNGDNGPNKWGYDVFLFWPVKRSNGQILFQDSVCPIYEKGGKRPQNIITGTKEVRDEIWGWE